MVQKWGTIAADKASDPLRRKGLAKFDTSLQKNIANLPRMLPDLILRATLRIFFDKLWGSVLAALSVFDPY